MSVIRCHTTVNSLMELETGYAVKIILCTIKTEMCLNTAFAY